MKTSRAASPRDSQSDASGNERKIIELLREMMTYRPVTADRAAVNRLVDFLGRRLGHAGVPTRVHTFDGRKALYAGPMDCRPDYLCNAHLDVVPGEEPMFELQERDGWLYGRGTHDCLGNCAMLASLLESLRGDSRLGVIFSTDEEVGGATTKGMVESGYGAERMVLILDGSGYSVITAQKGVLVVRLAAVGKGCHAAEPWKGDNAIDRLVDGYARVRNLFPPVEAGDEWHNTLAPTILQAGTVHNKVPDRAEMTLNIRFTEETTEERIMAELAARSGLQVIPELGCPVVSCDRQSPDIRRLVDCMNRHLEREIVLKRSNGATDARHFVDMGLPIAIIGVPGRDLHGDDECLEAGAIPAYTRLLADFIAG